MQARDHQLPDPHIVDPSQQSGGWTPEEIVEFQHAHEAEAAKQENKRPTTVTDPAYFSNITPPF